MWWTSGVGFGTKLELAQSFLSQTVLGPLLSCNSFWSRTVWLAAVANNLTFFFVSWSPWRASGLMLLTAWGFVWVILPFFVLWNRYVWSLGLRIGLFDSSVDRCHYCSIFFLSYYWATFGAIFFRVSWPTTNALWWCTSQTTIMAVEYNGGVILGADSRTTTGELMELAIVFSEILCEQGSHDDSRACILIDLMVLWRWFYLWFWNCVEWFFFLSCLHRCICCQSCIR